MTDPELAHHQKITIIGNCCSGKTHLSQKLSIRLNLPLYCVDGIQFDQNLKILPHNETIKKLQEIEQTEKWIIDGYGPLDILEARFLKSDLIIFLDPPLWVNYFLLFYRQIKNIWWPRKELPSGSDELTWQHTKKLFKTIWKVHKQMRPELIRILGRHSEKTLTLRFPTKQGVHLFLAQQALLRHNQHPHAE